MTQFNKLIQKKRLDRGDTVKGLARAIKTSVAFARHVLYADIVPVSPRIVDALSKHYRIPAVRLRSLVKHRNRIGKEYYRKWNAKNA